MTQASLFAGLSAFPLTPANASGKVETDALQTLVARGVAAGVDSICVMGSTGIYAYLTRAERRRAIDAAVSVAGSTPILAGIGALRSDEAIALARDAQEAGARGLLLAPMSYTPLTQDEVFEHFQSVASATNLPLCIYNNPSTTHFQFSLPLLRRLADIPTIVALKNPEPAQGSIAEELALLRTNLAAPFTLGYSGDWCAARALLAGADSWFSVVAGLFPVPALAMARAAQAGETDRVMQIDAQFAPLWALFKDFASLRVIYAAANLLALTDAQPPRPILPVPQEHTARLKAAIAPLVDWTAPWKTA
ncbi:4-hydroxy-tetrahydrodipicolinate synthase [Roseovarius marisflavi]|uniref:4-hydroxy-tetrahydrodipicolinate synthase n=1 Tax=Roseovarius marisflavi TaxID=1054996 RepID=A0A1M7C5I8_9RHOB|nr:dihydrodipicolinate synthase family protein [Roseovarius marisflavi]SHL62548.1 4-hydroxy-tetrahydrodipicolinate synthase [Roseovarius marisflavi]